MLFSLGQLGFYRKMSVLADVVIPGKVNPNPSKGLTSDAIPQSPSMAIKPENVEKGVSTKNTLSPTTPSHTEATPNLVQRSSFNVKRWYALRTTYGREQQAYEYLISHGATAYWPTIEVRKEVKGKRITVRQSRIPNILFGYGTLLEMQSFVYDNANLPFLRFYYYTETVGREKLRRPLVVPEHQMESLRIICAVDDGNITLVPQNDTHFRKGQLVRIIHGRFAGVTGRVARYQGQQRVAVIVDGLLTIATAYIPSAFLERIDKI